MQTPYGRPNPLLVDMLARALTAGEPGADAILRRLERTLGRQWRWMRPLAMRYLARFQPGDVHAQPRQSQVVRFLLDDRRFVHATERLGARLQVRDLLAAEPRMQSVRAAQAWAIPAIATEGELAQWLRLSEAEVAWFADRHALERRPGVPEAVRHYRYRWVKKRSGALRLLEAPKGRQKAIQRQILDEVLAAVPVHAAAHGFVRGRSIMTFAAPHVQQHAVLKMDLLDFFPSVSAARVQALLRMLGYPEAVADLLGALCTNRTAGAVLRRAKEEFAAGGDSYRALRELYERRAHLPQGAPTSPALANLCFFRCDCRLAGLAKTAGVAYTRYADDLAFSGGAEWGRSADGFAARVASIVRECGFAVNHRKTRLMRQGVRQRLAGLVVNQRVNVGRAEFDRLKATLTNCVKHGPVVENREGRPEFRAHLAGRVGFVESVHPARGAKLRALFERIDWRLDGS